VEDADGGRDGFTHDFGVLACKTCFPGFRGLYGSSLRLSGVSVGGRGKLLHVTVKGDARKYLVDQNRSMTVASSSGWFQHSM